jgi:fructosamine-3-kinase
VSEGLHRAIERSLSDRGRALRVTGQRRVGGGSIHRAALLELADGGQLFVKWNRRDHLPMFETEAAGLAALDRAGSLRVPSDPVPGVSESAAFLVMEAIPTGTPGDRRAFFETFGRRFAELHRATADAADAADAADRPARFGFQHDNFLGTTPQPNPWTDDWVDFFRQHRLGHQLRLARRTGASDPQLDQLGDRLLDRLDDLLDLADEPGCLLHGDLWSGNFLCDDSGEPVLVDPAASVGHREADLAMTRLFGGFDPAFYDAYDEAWPLPPGTERRDAVYRLYHLLNHLNLFGGGYRGQCVEVMRRLV